MFKGIAIVFIFGWAFISSAQSTPFVTETRQDLDIAIANYPERVKTGPEISTIQGNQISPGTLPRDFRINQQIYDDIAVVTGHVTAIMRMVFDLPSKPTLYDNIQVAMNQFLQLLTDLAVRYNLDLSSIRTELTEIRDELKNLPVYSRVNTILMVPYNRLDVIRAEIVNLLRTKLVTT